MVVAGIWLTQFLLYAPSLIGTHILLPLDCLAQPNTYLPATPEFAGIVPHDIVRSDLVLQFETERRFVASELRAGRFAMWLPYQYGGVPLVWPRYSPLLFLSCLTESPRILAWVQLAAATVAGLGMFAFCRRSLLVGFWPAAIASWCYPLTGFFVLWQGFPTCGAVYWWPWLLVSVDSVVRRPGSWWRVVALAASTALVLVGGHIDVAGQCLLAAGIFGVWRLFDLHRTAWRGAVRAMLMLGVGWSLGFMIAGPHVVPLLDYARTGARIENRRAGAEERPPVGIRALPLTVLPDFYGATRRGTVWIGPGNQIESAAGAYAGVIATFFLAPLAWCNRRYRSWCVCWTVLGALGLAWSLNVPGIVALLRLPGLNMMSHNRLVFVTSFALLVQAAIGLELLQQGRIEWRRWFVLPALAAAALGLWCFFRPLALPEPIGTQIQNAVQRGIAVTWIRTAQDVADMKFWFLRSSLVAAGLCLAAAAGWLLVKRAPRRPAALLPIALAMGGDLLWFARDRSAQCEPKLDYPPLPILQAIKRAPEGRVLGYGCLPATLLQSHGLPDVRGYDSIDPGRWVDVLKLAAAPGQAVPEYAVTQWYSPRAAIEYPDRIRVPGVLDMLGLRYVVFRGDPPPQVSTALRAPDYWALVNPAALPRAFVPRRVEIETSSALRLQKLGREDFDARQTAFVEEALPVVLPPVCDGTAVLVADGPARTSLAVEMKTPGVVVHGDRWEKGWSAYINGIPTQVLRVNHVLRGVLVSAGKATIEFRYEPVTVRWGLLACGVAVFVLLSGVVVESRRRGREPGLAV